MRTLFFSILLLMIISLKAQDVNNQGFKINKITIAISEIDQMVEFYNTVFNCKLQETNAYGTTLYLGKIGEINILLCPNEIAGVNAEQNRQQFDFIVTDLNTVIANVKSSGGKIKGELNVTDKTKTITVIDPDGNTIVFIQKLK